MARWVDERMDRRTDGCMHGRKAGKVLDGMDGRIDGMDGYLKIGG